jgi:hypothetical protein
MRSRTKVLIVASVPALLAGIWGAWLWVRTPLLLRGLEKGLERLRANGMVAEASPVVWDGLFSAHVDSVVGHVEGKGEVVMEDVQVHVGPAFSFSGRDWVVGVELGRMRGRWEEWRMEGKGRISLGSGGFAWEGEVWRGARGERLEASLSSESRGQRAELGGELDGGLEGAGLVGSARVRLWMGGLGRLGGVRRFRVGLVAEDCRVGHPALGNGIKDLGVLVGWGKVEAGKDRLALLPGACLQMGDAVLMGHGSWDGVARQFSADVALPRQAAQGVLGPLAGIAPDWLRGIEVQGEVEGGFGVAGDLDSLDGLRLAGGLEGHGIRVRDYGSVDLRVLQQLARGSSSMHLSVVPSMTRGSSFVPLSELPPYLVQAVVLSEDAGFWEHRGFDREIVRFALVENLQEGRFVRGAGTIPMQLIRNVFLHHGKQMDRKVAEVVLTWLAEEEEVLTKEEELGLYLNVIEWGPDVRGIAAAARYYFGKDPRDLNVDEAIFLACVIPNPHHADALLERDGGPQGHGGGLTAYAREYFDSMRWMLYEGDWIGEEWLEADYPRFGFRWGRI